MSETTLCEFCTGWGQQLVARIIPKCCGNVTPHGECRSDCAVPIVEDDIEQCPHCGGLGLHPAPSPVNPSQTMEGDST